MIPKECKRLSEVDSSIAVSSKHVTREKSNRHGHPLIFRELRERTALIQEEFAARLGVTYPTINRWENGRVKPSPLALKQIEDLLRDLGKKGRDLLEEFLGAEE